MSWTVVARKDFNDARRSRSLWALSGAFLLFAMMMASLYVFIPELSAEDAAELSTLGLMAFLAAPVAIFVSVAALVIAYKSMAGESESGSGKLLLSLPHSRRDVFLGKVVGRSLVLTVPVVVGMLAMLAIVFVGNVAFDPVDYALFAVVTLLFVLVYMALYVGISASTTSTTKAAALSVLVLIIVEFLWDVVPFGAWIIASGFQIPDALLTGNLTNLPNWVAFLANIPPSAAYQNAVSGILSGTISVSGSGPWYLSQGFSLVLLALWALIPAVIGYLRYNRADL